MRAQRAAAAARRAPAPAQASLVAATAPVARLAALSIPNPAQNPTRVSGPAASKALQPMLRSSTAQRGVVVHGSKHNIQTPDQPALYGLSLLNKAQWEQVQQDGTAKYNADIIFIHGLFGHPVESFKAPGSKKVWARDFVPEAMPGVRVFTFGYDAHHFSSGKGQVPQFARALLEQLVAKRKEQQKIEPDRPIIIVSHSLGGLVAMQASNPFPQFAQ